MNPVWHDGPLATLAPGDQTVAWSVALGTDPHMTPHAADLSDAARGSDGAARLARRLLARALVARLSGSPPDTVMIAHDAGGAPHVAAPSGWYVSLSGREHHALIGAARVPVGVDREPLARDDILWDTLSPPEARALRGLAAPDRPAAWLTRWTIKEAHAKLVGEPRRIAPEVIETRIDEDGRGSAVFEGRSETLTRVAHGGVETIAMWHGRGAPSSAMV